MVSVATHSDDLPNRRPNIQTSNVTAAMTVPVTAKLHELKAVSRSVMATGSVSAQGASGTREAKCPDSATFKGAEPLNPPCQTSRPV